MPKISICHLKLSKRSLSLAIRLRVRTSDGEFERVASLCSVPAGDTSDLSTLCLTRKPFGLCFFRRKDPCGSDSISFPTVTINKAWWEQWLPSCDHKDTISQRSVPGALTLGDVCSFRVAGGGRKQKASMIKWVWHECKLCPLLRVEPRVKDWDTGGWVSSRSVVFDSLQTLGLQHTRLRCPSPSPRL